MLTTKTRLLLIVTLGLSVLWFLGPQGGAKLVELPKIESFKDTSVERMEITVGADAKVALVREGEDDWRIEQPLTGDADALAVDSVLSLFRKGIAMDVLVDSEEVKTYGLSNSDRIVVEFFGLNEVPLTGFTLGWDVPGGASFVQLNGDSSVYRAKIGGRARYQKSAADWRNKMVLQMDPEDITGLHFERQTDSLHFLNEEGRWFLSSDPVYNVDQKGLVGIAKSFARIRASQLLSADFDGGFEKPAARVRISSKEGEDVVLLFGARKAKGAAFVKKEGEEQVYRVSAMKRDAALGHKAEYRSLQMMMTSPIQLKSVRLDVRDGSMRELSRRDDQLWEVTQPANVTGNLQDMAFGLNALSTLRAEGIHSGFDVKTGLDAPRYIFTISHANGQTDRIRVGNAFRDSKSSRRLFFVQKDGVEALFVVRMTPLQKILQAFNRSI
jgi:hypothetical protein